MNEMKKSAVIKSAFENRLGVGLVKHTMQTNPAVDQSKIIRWSVSPWNQSGRKGKGLWTKKLLKSQVLN